jgi:hypothetical protein
MNKSSILPDRLTSSPILFFVIKCRIVDKVYTLLVLANLADSS